MGDSDSTQLARNAGTYKDETTRAAWNKAVNIAVKILTQNTDEISNPIEDRRYFRSTGFFDDPERHQEINGQHQIKEKNKEGNYVWVNVKDIDPIVDNVFFRYGKKD
jgi:hypothetical protein